MRILRWQLLRENTRMELEADHYLLRKDRHEQYSAREDIRRLKQFHGAKKS
jgi:hypothetical protein